MSTLSSSQTGRSRVVPIILALALAIVLLLAAAVSAFYVIVVRIPAAAVHNTRVEAVEAARQISTAIKDFFNFTPEVSVGNRTVVEQASPITELATVKQHVLVEHSWSHSWAGSTKTIVLEGTFIAKAGFDLHEPFQIAVAEEPLEVRATLPEAKLLSLELKDYRVRKDDDGWWNNIRKSDREEAVKGMIEEAATRVQQTGIMRKAERMLEEQMRQGLAERGVAPDAKLEFSFRRVSSSGQARMESGGVSAPPD